MKASFVTTLALTASLLCAAAAVCAAAGPAQAAAPDAGLYTQAQAGRGSALFAKFCAACHGVDLTGTDYGPGLTDRELLSRWKNRSLGDLFVVMQSTMPVNSPGGLSMEQNVDLLAFLLQRSRIQAGATELPGKLEALTAIKVAALKPTADQK